MQKPKNFKDFLNEASLKGNVGIPGEQGEGPSWLDTVNREQRQKAMNFERENRNLLMNFPTIIGDSQRLQRGKEDELSSLAETCIRKLFGSIINDVELDLKISRADVQQMLSETPDKPEMQRQNLEDIVNQKILNEIQKRKILRTIQQGKGLNSKAVLNLPLFKDGVKEILKDRAEEYIETLNKIVKVMNFFDTTLPEAEIARALRGAGTGACDLEFPEKELDTEKKEVDAEKLLQDLEDGKDLSETETELFDDIQTTVKARGADLGVLVHEAIKGIYKLATQMSLEHLSEKEAEEVLSNTDTLLDEAQELKYGREMEDQFKKVVMANPKVKEVISYYEGLLDSGTAKEKDQAVNDIASFQEQLFFYVFGYLAAMQDSKKMLEIVHVALIDNKEQIEILLYPIIEESIKSLKQEIKFQKQVEVETPVSTPQSSGEKTKEELMELLDDAKDNENFEEAARLRDEIKKRFPEK